VVKYNYGTEVRTIRKNQALLSKATKTSENQKSGRAERNAVPGGKWVQMEGHA